MHAGHRFTRSRQLGIRNAAAPSTACDEDGLVCHRLRRDLVVPVRGDVTSPTRIHSQRARNTQAADEVLRTCILVLRAWWKAAETRPDAGEGTRARCAQSVVCTGQPIRTLQNCNKHVRRANVAVSVRKAGGEVDEQIDAPECVPRGHGEGSGLGNTLRKGRRRGTRGMSRRCVRRATTTGSRLYE